MKSLPHPKSPKFYLMFSSKIFIVLHWHVSPHTIHFWVNFCLRFIFCLWVFTYFSNVCCKSYLFLNEFWNFIKIFGAHLCESMFRFSVLFHWPTCLFLCHFHTVLITIAANKSLNPIKWFLPLYFAFYKLLKLL